MLSKVPRITCYFDVASAHCLFAFEELINYRQSTNTPVSFIPVHAASIMNTIGHKIPYYEKTLRDYNFYEVKTLGKIYGLDINPPDDAFDKLSNTGTFCAQRFLAAVQELSPQSFEPACREAWARLWSKNHFVHSDSDFNEICESIGLDRNTIMSALPGDKWTLKINDNNRKVIEQKCFGVPWISATNSCNQNATFFGADRLPLVFRFLEENDRRRSMVK